MSRRCASLLLGLLTVLALSACEQKMADQPKYRPLGTAQRFPDNRVAQAPPAGAVPRSAVYDGQQAPTYTLDELHRGRERFEIFCSPCHGLAGQADGPVVQRGFPAPPSYHSDRLRQAPDAHFFDVMTNGYGIMYSYADRVPVADRWAIVAYIRALQLSQHTDLGRYPELRAAVESAARGSGGRPEAATATAPAVEQARMRAQQAMDRARANPEAHDE